ncbi:MAG: RNA methyltransferase [Deltaproteobacteria bacterium]|nr:RNA methyltransferase [Deltaproteobacteria bacterium]
MPRCFAAAPRGVEAVTVRELEALGATGVETDFGGVHFEGDTALLCRANLCLRTATRVLVTLKTFSAANKVMLYDQVRRIRWDEHLTPSMTFAVDVKMASRPTTHDSRHRANRESQIPNPKSPDRRLTPHASRLMPDFPPHFAALKIKDAIADEMRKLTGARPDVDTKDPDVRVHAYLSGSRCTISLDSSGKSLHERGYRTKDTGAPLKEALAAAIVGLSGWDGETPLLDPMCGSGTLVIEAAMKALNIPPGLKRKQFGFMRWPGFDHKLWQDVLSQARAGIIEKPRQPILGFDSDPEAIKASIENAGAAGVAHAVTFARRPIENLRPAGDRPGIIIMNPPYGMRLTTPAKSQIPNPGSRLDSDMQPAAYSLQPLYQSIGDVLKHHMKGWTAFIFTGNPETVKQIGLRTSKRITLFNGPLECRLLRYDLY